MQRVNFQAKPFVIMYRTNQWLKDRWGPWRVFNRYPSRHRRDAEYRQFSNSGAFEFARTEEFTLDEGRSYRDVK